MGYLRLHALAAIAVCVGMSLVWSGTVSAKAPTVPEPGDESSGQSSIYGGTVADPASYPFYVQLVIRDGDHERFCGGSLISDSHVLTAAHCIKVPDASAQDLTVRFGAGSPISESSVEFVDIHPKYKVQRTWAADRPAATSVLLWDMAILTLDEPVGYQPAVLGQWVGPANPEDLVTAIGKGRTAPNPGGSPVLLEATMTAMSYHFEPKEKSCQWVTFGVVGGFTCVEMGESQLCKGDSGGAWLVREKLVAVTSGGYKKDGTTGKCGDSDFGVGIEVFASWCWIESKTNGTAKWDLPEGAPSQDCGNEDQGYLPSPPGTLELLPMLPTIPLLPDLILASPPGSEQEEEPETVEVFENDEDLAIDEGVGEFVGGAANVAEFFGGILSGAVQDAKETGEFLTESIGAHEMALPPANAGRIDECVGNFAYSEAWADYDDVKDLPHVVAEGSWVNPLDLDFVDYQWLVRTPFLDYYATYVAVLDTIHARLGNPGSGDGWTYVTLDLEDEPGNPDFFTEHYSQVLKPMCDELISLGGALVPVAIVDPDPATDVGWPDLVSDKTSCGNGTATIVGTEGDDILIGTGKDDVIVGLGGNDIIFGKGGFDVICGGQGDDVIDGGWGYDRISGGEGNDVIRGDRGPDIITGGLGDDHIEGNPGGDTISGNQGDDYIHGGQGKDDIGGDMGNDRLYGGDEDDTINGGSGNDKIYGHDGRDWMNGNSGDDIIYGQDNKDWLHGGPGVDVCDGGKGKDSIDLKDCETIR